jgi:acyl-CoA synthetase (AMP-forming)/AMP-acid ligase II
MAARDVSFSSLAELLHSRAEMQSEDCAYVALSDRGQAEATITYGELERRAIALAGEIALRARPRDRALLLCPNGIGFMVGFLACVLAGVIAVPMMLPRRQSARDASASILADCEPRLALAPAELLDGTRGDLIRRFAAPGLEWLAVDGANRELAAAALRPGAADDVAFLQYTSGSTSAPKGVMVSHANLLANLAMIAEAFGNDRRSTYVSWVPLYHDMGLIINALQALFIGATCILMAPVAFVQRPMLWLRAISEYRAQVAGGPNFAFDLCVERYRPEQMEGVDLSCWRVAFNGAEPVRAETIRRFNETFAPHGFAPRAMYPAYGMAEATVLISAGVRGAGAQTQPLSRDALRRHRVVVPRDNGDVQHVVGCGQAPSGETIAIVDPESLRRLANHAIGEVWVAGPNVARGYWRNPEATAAAFAGRIVGEDEITWLRTGDLGFLDDTGELYITGRLKEVVIVRGANHYPQDIEHTVQSCHPALRLHGGAAFTATQDDANERLVVVQEVERTHRGRIEEAELIGRIREAVVAEHDIAPAEIVLLRPGALPKTTSGKIQRTLARQLWLDGALGRL